MSVRLIAVDLDGTLIGDDLTISAGDRLAIERAMAQGVIISLVTGRLFAAARRFAEQLGLASPIACLQGAAIYEAKSGRLMRAWPLSTMVALRAYDFMLALGYHLQLYFGDALYVQTVDERLDEYLRRSQIEAVKVADLRALLGVSDGSRGDLLKVLGIASAADVQRDIPRLTSALGAGAASVVMSQPTYLEVTDPQADKGSALRYIAASIGVPLSQTAAIGDSDNDVPMLRAAGASFAVAGATPAARNAAGRVVGSQGKGVADAIEALCGADACGIP